MSFGASLHPEKYEDSVIKCLELRAKIKSVRQINEDACMDAGGGGGHLCGRGVGGDGGEGDGGRVGAIGLMCNVSECNIEMRRSFETGRTRLGLSRTGATSPWGRTRSSTSSRRSLTRGRTRGTSSNLSSAAFILGATEVQDHRFQGMTGAHKQTILVEKAFLGQSDGKRCKKGPISVADQCERAAKRSENQ